jgi:hypothetical protein
LIKPIIGSKSHRKTTEVTTNEIITGRKKQVLKILFKIDFFFSNTAVKREKTIPIGTVPAVNYTVCFIESQKTASCNKRLKFWSPTNVLLGLSIFHCWKLNENVRIMGIITKKERCKKTGLIKR